MMTFGLLGRTLSHSLSVPIHEMYFELTGSPGSYRLVELAPGHVMFLREIMGALGLTGLNVTIPYKRAVMPLMDELTPEAEAVGAVNTVHMRGGRLTGHNTDVYGFRALLRENAVDARGKVCALLGATGGAARAARQALVMEGAGKLLLVSRNAPDASAREGAGDCEWMDYQALERAAFDILVNCTPSGMAPNVHASPVSAAVAARAGTLVDMIYNPPETLLLAHGRAAGRRTVNGLYMLVAQAVAAEAFWRGEAVDEQVARAIHARMREAI